MTISKKLINKTLEKLLILKNKTGKNLDSEENVLSGLLSKPVQINESFVADIDPDDEQIIVSDDEQSDIESIIQRIDADFELYQ